MQNEPARQKLAADMRALAKEKSLRPAPEWIEAIRRLFAANKETEARDELRKFRAAYGPEADALLPPDLRAIKTPQ